MAVRWLLACVALSSTLSCKSEPHWEWSLWMTSSPEIVRKDVPPSLVMRWYQSWGVGETDSGRGVRSRRRAVEAPSPRCSHLV